MASLFELTDYTPEEETLPVADPLPTDRPRVIINTAEFDKPKEKKTDDSTFNLIGKGLKNLFGLDEENPHYQLWPEKMVREALTSAGDIAKPNPYPEGSEEWYGYEDAREKGMVPAAMAISALAGTGGLAGTGAKAGEVALGATPFLRPALKHKDKLYKGKLGQEHQDIIPKELYEDFRQKAMSGEDLAEYNFGFINDKGHFLDREKALQYGIDTGLIDPHSGRFGALTTTLMADSSKPGTAIEAVKTASPFYSAVEHTVKNIPQEKMTGEQWLGTLANKPGVKGEELDWIGLREFLNDNKGKSVTKQQIEDHIASNKVELKEINKGTPPDELMNGQDLAQSHGHVWSELSQADRMRYIQTANGRRLTQEAPTKYHSYQLPGGENYREMLMTLPKQSDEKFIKSYEASTGTNLRQMLGHEPTAQEIANLRRYSAASEVGGEYKSSHWDEPNILAHVRMNDRNIDGKKSLHLEEIQSDWHQQGRDKGYRPEQEKKMVELIAKRDELQKEASALSPSDARYKEIYKELPTIQTKINDIASSDVGVPDAPFKKTWHELALKRMLREAAEKGYDKLSWTPGEAQAARYDLSKQVDNIKYLPAKTSEITGKHYEGRLIAYDKNGKVVIDKEATPNQLSDFVGKEVADKLLKTDPAKSGSDLRPYHYLTNQDLKIGGEGMKGFYDQIIPKALEKLGKEHGVKVQKGEITTGERTKSGMSGVSKDIKAPIFYIDIPQSLKDTALNRGFPLFSNIHPGYTFIPFVGNPFENEK